MRLFTVWSVVLLCAALSLSARDSAPFKWSGSVATGKTLTISGVSGSIKVEKASGSQVEVTALRSARKSNPDDVQIKVVPTAEGLTVCANYPGEGNDCVAGHSSNHNDDTSVEFTVKIPSSLNLKAKMVNGSIAAHDLRGDVDAATVNGKIDVSSMGSVSAKSVNGSIIARMDRVNWTGPRHFDTVNGTIDLDLPASASADVKVTTVNGAITTDFPLTVQGKIMSKSINGTLGKGGRELKISTVNGSVRLRRHDAGII